MKRALFIALTLIAGLSFSAHHAEASTQACDLQAGIQKFFDAKGAELKLELDTRKGLLYLITDCSKEETENAVASLESLEVNDEALASAKTQLLDRLKQDMEYVEYQKTRVSDVGLRGTKDLAQTIKEWRGNTHAPQLANANNFVLFEKNQSLITIAETRNNQIAQTLRTLKLSDRDTVRENVDQANKDLQEAQDMNATARQSLIRLENPDLTARALRNSFNALSSTYKSFFKVSEEVKKILPL